MAKQKKPTFKQRQKAFVKKVNKAGDELGIAIIAKLDITEDGITPKLFLADLPEKKK